MGKYDEVTDDMMKEFLSKVKPYTLMILHKTSKFKTPDVSAIVWEHGRRNMQFRLKGKMNITCPVHDETDLMGIIVFSTDLEETKRIMDQDPGVKAGIFTYELHATKASPGSSLKIQNCAQFFFLHFSTLIRAQSPVKELQKRLLV